MIRAIRKIRNIISHRRVVPSVRSAELLFDSFFVKKIEKIINREKVMRIVV